jgi:hypothetical protein
VYGQKKGLYGPIPNDTHTTHIKFNPSEADFLWGGHPATNRAPGGAWGHPLARARAQLSERAHACTRLEERAPDRYQRRRSPPRPGAPAGSPSREPTPPREPPCRERSPGSPYRARRGPREPRTGPYQERSPGAPRSPRREPTEPPRGTVAGAPGGSPPVGLKRPPGWSAGETHGRCDGARPAPALLPRPGAPPPLAPRRCATVPQGAAPERGAGAACRRVPAGKFFDFFAAKGLTWHEAVCSIFLSIPKGATKGNLQHV